MRTTPQAPPETDDELRRLLEDAGPRPEVPPDDFDRLRAAARAEWRRLPGPARRLEPAQRPLVPLALAASLVGAVVVGWLWLRREPPVLPPAPPVATLEAVRGAVLVDDAPAGAAGTPLAAGATVATAAEPSARVALRLGGGSVRLDAATRVRLAAADRIELERGAVYVDSRPDHPGAPLVVVTELGRVREVGTQFEVRLEAGSPPTLDVRVREGRVEVAAAGDPLAVGAGERLRLRTDGAAERSPLAAWAPEWEWVLAAAPPPAIEGRSLRSFLDWSCRENGLRLRFESPATERSAAGIVLHGTVEGLRPEEALAAVLAGAGLEHRIEGGELVIRTPG